MLKAGRLFKIVALGLLFTGSGALHGRAAEIPARNRSHPQQQAIVEDIVGLHPYRQHISGLLLKPAVSGEIRISLLLPPRHHVLEGFASQYLVKMNAGVPLAISHDRRTGNITDTRVSIPFVTAAHGTGTLEVQAVYGYCNDLDKVCIPREVVWNIEFTLDPQRGGEMVELEDKP